jgi:23S rRNA-/tRNA-specific pseudouridylate synthase
VLADVKKLVAKENERLHLVESLDRCASGVVYFAKSVECQKRLKQCINEGKATHRFRVIVCGAPENPTADINIPLRKVTNGRDVRWVPLLTRTSDPISYDVTRYKVINQDTKLHVSLMDVFVNKSSNVNQVSFFTI